MVGPTSKPGAKGFIAALINYFARFSVPEELSTDGIPKFTVMEKGLLLERCTVKHHLSSAFHPRSE